MANNPSTTQIVPKLVAWFNGLPPEQRVIRPLDMPFYKIKIAKGSEGQEDIVIGDLTASNPASYVGEASYVWIGPRHETAPQTARAAYFFEISKFVNNPATGRSLNIVNRVATYIGLPPGDGPSSIGNDLNNLPTSGDYVYQFIMTASNSLLWGGDYIELVIDNNTYRFYPEMTGDTFGEFRAYTDSVVILSYVGAGSIGSTFQCFQHPAGAGDEVVDVYFGLEPSAPEFTGPMELANFIVPIGGVVA